jgi:hypothetical protein
MAGGKPAIFEIFFKAGEFVIGAGAVVTNKSKIYVRVFFVIVECILPVEVGRNKPTPARMKTTRMVSS